MSQAEIAPVVAHMTSINAHEFFSRVPDGVWNLCEQGADKEARDNDDMTPLRCASLFGHLPVVQYLRER